MKMAVLLIGSLVVFYMGVQLIRAEPTLGQGRDVQVPLGKVVGIACVVTWFNPQALIDGTLLLGAFRATLPPTGSTAFILGVAAASAAWFLTVATLTSLFRSRFTPRARTSPTAYRFRGQRPPSRRYRRASRHGRSPLLRR